MNEECYKLGKKLGVYNGIIMFIVQFGMNAAFGAMIYVGSILV